MRYLKLIVVLNLLIGVTLPAQAETIRDVVYGHKDGMALVLDVYKPEANANGAAVAYMISGGWMSSEGMQRAYESMFMPLVNAGYTVFAIRHGSSPRFNVPEAYGDVTLGFQFVAANAAQYGVDPARIGVSGISAGGHLSLLLGLDTSKSPVQRPAAVVAYMPPTDLKNIVGPNDNFPALNFDVAIAPTVSPVEFVSADDPPVLLVHGNADELVPIANSERIYALLQSAGVITEFVVIEGAPHGLFTGDGGVKAAAALLGWFETHLL